MTADRRETFPDAFLSPLVATGHWSGGSNNSSMISQSIRGGSAFIGDWHDITWHLHLPYYNDPPHSYRLTLAAGDRRIQVLLLIVYGEQRAALLAALQDHAGSRDYIGFLERVLSTDGVHLFNLKSYRYHWKGLHKDVSQRVQLGQVIQLFSVPTVFEPMSWIDFESATWVEQHAPLSSAHFATVYQRWLPLMPPDFDSRQYRSLHDMLHYLIYDTDVLDAAQVEDGYDLRLLPVGGSDNWFLNLWEQVSDLFPPNSYITLQDDNHVFWKIVFTQAGFQHYREKF